MKLHKKEEGVHHATVISKIEVGKIYYSGNTVNRFNHPLSLGIGNDDSVLLIRINDAA